MGTSLEIMSRQHVLKELSSETGLLLRVSEGSNSEELEEFFENSATLNTLQRVNGFKI
jgi:hypothetical protein